MLIKKPSVIKLIFAVVSIVFLSIAMHIIVKNEPIYKEHRLSYWLGEFDSLKSDEAGEAMEALEHIGTNCIPTLLGMVRSKDSSVKSFVLHMMSKQSFLAVNMRSSDQLHHEAYIAFYVLRGRGKTAIPGLAASLRDANPDVRNCALKSLIAIGPEARKTLEEAAHDSDRSVSSMAESGLALLDSETFK
jgi:hypothetical protein